MADDEKSPFEPRKILVRDLAPNTTEDDLNHYFTQFSDVTELADVTESIIPHNSVTGSPHSFGFVVFRYPAALRIPFILQLPHCILDRCVEVSRALKGEDLQTLESQRKVPTCEDNFERIGIFDERKIIVRGRSPRPGITDDGFLRFFQGFGHVIDCFWNYMGFGHVTFRMKRGADRVLYRRSYILNGWRLTVNARNPNVSRAINIQEEAGESSGSDQANGTTRDMQPQASPGDSHARNVQIVAAAESSGTDHVIKKRRKSFKEKRDDLWYQHIFDKYEKLEEKANKKLKQDEETDHEEMSDQGSGQSNESEKKVGDEVEVYAGAIKSGSDEDEEDNNPDEVYSTSYDPNTDLDYDLNNIVYAPGDLCLRASAVVASDGQLLYWTSTFPQVNLEEISELWRAFDLGGNREVHIAGERYMMVKAEPYLMCGGDVAVFRTRNTLVFGLSEDPVIPRQCIERTRKIADYMEQQGM